jgi:hypothetical protein
MMYFVARVSHAYSAKIAENRVAAGGSRNSRRCPVRYHHRANFVRCGKWVFERAGKRETLGP